MSPVKVVMPQAFQTVGTTLYIYIYINLFCLIFSVSDVLFIVYVFTILLFLLLFTILERRSRVEISVY